MSTLTADTFSRANQTNWGTASSGDTWGHIDGAGTESIVSNKGQITGANDTNVTTLGAKTATNVDVVVQLSVSATNARAGVVARVQDANTYYIARLNGSTNQVQLCKFVGGTLTILQSASFTVSASTFYWLRFRATSTSLSARAWTTTEPGSWTVSTTDSSISAAGTVGLYSLVASTSTIVDYDNFTATNLTNSLDFAMRAGLIGPTRVDFAMRAGLTSLVFGQLGSDTFVRGNQTNWGTASDGQAWAQIDGNQAASIVSDAGQITGGQGSAVFVLGTKQAQDVDLKMLGSVSASTSRHGVLGRVQNSTTLYRVYWKNGNLIIERLLADTPTQLASTSFAETLGSTYYVRAQIYGNSPTTINAKIWASSGSEPSIWTLTATDTNPITGVGQHGIYLYTNTNGDTATASTYLAANLTLPHDFRMRAGLAGLGIRDFAMRAGLGGLPSSHDWKFRAGAAGFSSRDFAMRAGLDATLTPLPTYTPGLLAVQIGTRTFTIQEQTLSYSETTTGRSTCQFTITDTTGAVHFRFRERLTITHAQRGVVFRGFVNTAQEQNLAPNAANTIQVTGIDEHWIPDKRIYEGSEFENEQAGTIAVFLAQQLKADGVTAGYAVDLDTLTADFAEGTLNNVVAAANTGSTAVGDGDLELAPAGDQLSITESTQTDFATGTLSSVQANHAPGSAAESGTLSLLATNAIKLSGTCAVAGGGNLYSYVKIWAGSYTVQSNDYLTYDVWIASTSPESKSGVDVTFTDGTTLRDFNNPVATDLQSLGAHPNTDLSSFAKDQWYSRQISLFGMSGKTIAYVTVAFEGDSTGDYTSFFRNINVTNLPNNFVAGTIQTWFFAGSFATTPQQMQNAGYKDVSAVVAPTYEKSGSRLSPAIPLSASGIVRDSLITWTATYPLDSSGKALSSVTITIEASLDNGATWQTCTSGQPIPCLRPGYLTPGRFLMLRETLTNGTSDATLTPLLTGTEITIVPSFATSATKIDILNTTSLSADWLSGTLSNLSVTGAGLSLVGAAESWDTHASLLDGTVFGTAVRNAGIVQGQLQMTCGTASDARLRMDSAGQWQNFTAEIDVNVGTANGNYGLVYRTTGWQNNNDTYAYSAFVNTGQIALGKGTNSSSGSGVFTLIATAALALSSGNWHRLKVVANGTTHQVYLDDVLYITATDSTYTAAGYLGVRFYNNTGSDASAQFDTFGVAQALSGSRVSPPMDLSSAGSVQDSLIAWSASTPGNTSVMMEVSLDGGSTWQAATNGAAIPGLSQGMPLSGVTLTTRQTLTTASAAAQPTLGQLSTLIVGSMLASGSRLSPPLALGAVGHVGSGSISWDATLPSDATTLGIDVSLDGTNWTDITATTGQQITDGAGQASIPVLTGQSEPFFDLFQVDNTASYASGTLVPPGQQGMIAITTSVPRVFGGTLILHSSVLAPVPVAVWSVDTPNSRIIATGGTYAYLSTQQMMGDGEILLDTDSCDNGGVAWALDPVGLSGYLLAVQDSAAPRSPNRMRLYKIVGGKAQQLGNSFALSFVRGTPTRFKVVQLSGTITVTVDTAVKNTDGSLVSSVTQTMTYTDPSPLPAGAVALLSNGGTNRFSHIRCMSYGDDATAETLYVRARLASTDPTNTPQLQSLTVTVHDPRISDGALIPATTYSTLSGSTNTIAQDLDDLARQSSTDHTYWWDIENGALTFQPEIAYPSPWIVTASDLLFAANSGVQVVYNADLYRNEAIIVGGTDTITVTESFIADGIRTSYPTGEPIQSIDAIAINGQAVSFGVQGIDTGKDWYYQVGKQGITQDVSQLPVPEGTPVTITYEAEIRIVAKAQNIGQITLLSALDGTSGIVSVAEKADGLSSAAAQALALSRVKQYGVIDACTLTFTTARPGLRRGQLLTVFLPQHGLINQPFLITQVDYALFTAVVNGQATAYEQFKVQATSGPLVGDWTYLYA